MRMASGLVGWGTVVLLGLASAQQQPLAVLQGDGLDNFGLALRIAGDVDGDGIDDFIVGAPDADPAGDRSGRAWVFSGADRSVLHVFDGTTPLYKLGKSVDGAGDVDGDGHADLIVGEPASTTAATTPGRAHVYSGSDGSLLHVVSGTDLLGDFGTAVAGLGDVDGDGLSDFAVGAPDEGGIDQAFRGSVSVFSGRTGTLLFQVQSGLQHGQLGWTVAAAGDVDGDGVPDFLVSDPHWKGQGSTLVGGAFLLSGVDGHLLVLGSGAVSQFDPENVGLTAGMLGDVDGDGWRDFFGGGDRALVIWSGADGSLVGEEEVWLSSVYRVVAADLGDVDGDGRDDVLVGHPEGGVLASDGGLAFARSGGDDSVLMVQRGASLSGFFGATLAVLGDADRDGRPEYLAGQPGAGSKVLLHEFEPSFVATAVPGTDPISEGFGTVVRAAGDVDNDGSPDVIAGEPFDSTTAFEAGRATVLSGRDGSALQVFLGAATIDRLGWAVDAAGDIDRDGHGDLVVGAPFRSFPLPGAAYVYSGRTGALLHEFHGKSHGDRFGMSVAGVGDIDGDAVPDVLVGSPYDDTQGSDYGAAVVYSGATGDALAELQGDSTFSSFGLTVGGGGDVDADGVPDLLVRVANAPVGIPPTHPGTVRVYSGATRSLLHVLVGEKASGTFGWSLDDAGDVDGDGHADVVVGEPFSPGGSNTGAVSVHSGATGAKLYSRSANGRVGWSVAGGQDVSGDGVPDIATGVPFASVLESRDGELWILSGLDGSLLRALLGAGEDCQLGSAADFAGDLDFDGLGDVVGGTLHGVDQDDGDVVLWSSGDGSSPWMNLGGVLPGDAGAPHLFPSGSLLPAQPVTLKLTQAKPLAPATLIAGLSQLGAPFKGGTLVPQPTFLIGGLLTNGAGTITLTTPWPAGLPSGVSVHLQYWIVDGTGSAGFTASNGVRGTVP